MMQILFKARKGERKMGWEGKRGMVGSEAFFASVSPSLKRIRFQEERDELYVGRNRCSVTHISCKICSKIQRIYHRIHCGYIVQGDANLVCELPEALALVYVDGFQNPFSHLTA